MKDGRWKKEIRRDLLIKTEQWKLTNNDINNQKKESN
jgi:hypothetical protein